MKKLALTIAVFGLFMLGCQHQYWTITESEESETVTVSETTPEPEVEQPEVEPEPEPEVEPPTPKEIIFILGVDGMD